MWPQFTQWACLHHQLSAEPRCFPTEPGLQGSLLWRGCVLLAHLHGESLWDQVTSHFWISCPQEGLVAISPWLAHISIPPRETSSPSRAGHLSPISKICWKPAQTHFSQLQLPYCPRGPWAVSETVWSQLHHPSPPCTPCPRLWVPTGVVPTL